MRTKNERSFVRLTAAIFLVLALLPAFAAAQEKKTVPPATNERPGRLVAREALGLTPEQEKTLMEFREARMAERKAFGDEMAKLHAELRDLAKDPKANQTKIDALIDKTSQLRAEQEKAGFRNRAEREKIFTPEQREKMKTFRERLERRPGLAGRAPMSSGRMGLRGPARFMGRGMELRRLNRMRALRLRRFLRWRRW